MPRLLSIHGVNMIRKSTWFTAVFCLIASSAHVSAQSDMPVLKPEQIRAAEIARLNELIGLLQSRVDLLEADQQVEVENDPIITKKISVLELLKNQTVWPEGDVLIASVRNSIINDIAPETWIERGGDGVIEFFGADVSLVTRNRKSIVNLVEARINALADISTHAYPLGIRASGDLVFRPEPPMPGR